MRRVPAAVLTATALFGAAVAAGGVPAAAVAPGDTVTLKATGSITVTYRGNGHGHGMSQYGAYGAALAGLHTNQILAHYYPGTSVKTMPQHSPVLRVKLGKTGSTTIVYAERGLNVTGVRGTLASAGVSRYRLVADNGSGLTLQRMASARGSKYTTVASHLPNNARFAGPRNTPLRVLLSDGTSTWYYGTVRAVRKSQTGSAGGVATVNLVSYNFYAAGVAPREMPASWGRTATAAQAMAARTYAVYEQQHAGNGYYDVCDTTACQVYGGHEHLDRSGHVLWNDLPQAASDTSNKVLTYQGAPIFAQYSASNGGYSTDGGQPYLRAAADQYDPGKSQDPYVGATERVSTASLAGYYGLATVTKVVITSRDGHGAWGGRVLTATVYGTDSHKKARAVTTDGEDLQWAFGLDTTWFSVKAS